MKFPEVNTRYGAPHGRPTFALQTAPQPEPRSLRLFKVALDAGGYDNGGAYWGLGEPLYCLMGDHVQEFVRAANREDAARQMNVDPRLLIRPLARTTGFDDQYGRPFTVRVIRRGERYGNGARAEQALVEFSRPHRTYPAYALDDLLTVPSIHGLMLMDTPDVRDQLDHTTMERVMRWVKGHV